MPVGKHPLDEPAKYTLLPYLFAFLYSLIVAVAISSISRIPSRFVFSAIFPAITFLICCSILPSINMKLRLKAFDLGVRASEFDFNVPKELFVPTIYAASLVLVAVISPIGGIQFTNWLQISVANYARLFAGLLLSSMLPSYGLLRLIDRKKRFVGLDSIVFSFL